jgi:hypothetical protein
LTILIKPSCIKPWSKRSGGVCHWQHLKNPNPNPNPRGSTQCLGLSQ